MVFFFLTDEVKRVRDAGASRGEAEERRAGEKTAGGDAITGRTSHPTDQVQGKAETTGSLVKLVLNLYYS